jgi:CPA1 family monovalent cation:H+ antiporter
VRLKEDRVQQGQTTVTSDVEREGFEEFWRRRVREFGLSIEEIVETTDLDDVDGLVASRDDESDDPGPSPTDDSQSR